MTARPSEYPRWAYDSSDALGTNVAAPSSGQRDTGWTPSQPYVTSYDNRVKAFTGLWIQYFDGLLGSTINIPASEWHSEGGQNVWNTGQATYSVSGGKWTWAGFDDLTFGLRLAVGVKLTSAKWNYNRTGGTLNFKIQKRAAGAGAWTDIVTGSDNTTAGAGSKTLSCAEVIAADTQYRLYIDSSGVATFDVASYTT